ncbi:hypothetical protein G3N59_25555 [Paraburkholderia sp. Ac-20340]|uniref:hypothetical protein n=1 Tax=Paraburkholderia sp. Ac-20340 TaxID=2703888 RepID=UPI0019809848|nr:hypothetical protein [Paraburkholderia sp. Ac-20340]MBN3856750.1 hypothetical protein [Paraburkholderia sp. Ac-20340]
MSADEITAVPEIFSELELLPILAAFLMSALNALIASENMMVAAHSAAQMTPNNPAICALRDAAADKVTSDLLVLENATQVVKASVERLVAHRNTARTALGQTRLKF